MGRRNTWWAITCSWLGFTYFVFAASECQKDGHHEHFGRYPSVSPITSGGE